MNPIRFSRNIFLPWLSLSSIVLIAMMLVALSGVARAQQSTQVRNLLQRFKNWRYGMISVYKVGDEGGLLSNLNIVLGPAEPELPDEAKSCKNKDDIEAYVLTGGEGMDEEEIKKYLSGPGCKAYERYYTLKKMWEDAQFKKAYVVTTRRQPNEPFQIIGFLTQKKTESYYGLKDDLDPPSDIFLESDLSKDLDEQKLVNGVVKKSREILQTSAATLYQYLENQIIQGNLENVTPEAQGIGEENIRFTRKTYGNTTAISEDETQTYIRITEGLPADYQNENEIIVSLADGISYRRYERPKADDGSTIVPDSGSVGPATNNNLPKYGVELRYGLEDINYPSLWSERMSLNALWGASRLGLVLPTSGWSSLASDLGATRTMTNAGIGINGSFDFPIRVVSQSGVFNVSASYVFDDAAKTDHQVFDADNRRFVDNLVRFHAAAHYTFAVRIDKDFMFRFRLGGTVYNMEQWGQRQLPGDTAASFAKLQSETIGGVSGRIDFMTTGWATPVGFSISYFDDTMLGLAWLQVPVMPEMAIRFDARIFTPVFRDARLWEREAIVLPSIRFVFNF